MREYILIFYILFLFSFPLISQSISLSNFDVVLVGPKNTNRHHPAQIDYYIDYYKFLEEEVDLWLSEINLEQSIIKRRNRKRIRKKKPIRLADYPKWKYNRELVESLESDKQLVTNFISYWQDYNVKPDSVLRDFQKIYDEDLCFDIISKDIVLSKEEYSISLYEAPKGTFDWEEFIQRQKGNCPTDYLPSGKTCNKHIEIETTFQKPLVFNIMNLLDDLPIHLDGWKKVTCFADKGVEK